MKPLVLVVEDCDMQRELLADYLIKICSCDVICSCDGEDGIGKVEKEGEKINIVFTDLLMPRKNGLEVARFVKENFPAIKVVMMTSNDINLVREKAILSGVDNLLAKPFNIFEVKRFVDELTLLKV